MYGAWLREKLRLPENMIGARWIVEEGRTGRTEDYDDEEESEHAEEAKDSHNERGASHLTTESLNIDAQEEALPVLDFNRRKSNSNSSYKQIDIRSSNVHVTL